MPGLIEKSGIIHLKPEIILNMPEFKEHLEKVKELHDKDLDEGSQQYGVLNT